MNFGDLRWTWATFCLCCSNSCASELVTHPRARLPSHPQIRKLLRKCSSCRPPSAASSDGYSREISACFARAGNSATVGNACRLVALCTCDAQDFWLSIIFVLPSHYKSLLRSFISRCIRPLPINRPSQPYRMSSSSPYQITATDKAPSAIGPYSQAIVFTNKNVSTQYDTRLQQDVKSIATPGSSWIRRL